MHHETIGAAMAVAAHLMLGVMVYWRGVRERTHQLFLALSISMAVWNLGFFLAQGGLYPTTYGGFWWSVMYCGVFFIPPTALHFILHFTGVRRTGRVFTFFAPYFLYAIGFILCFGLFTDFYQTTPGIVLVVLYMFPPLFYCVGLIYWKRERARSSDERTRLNYMLSASIIATLAGATNFIPYATGIGNTASIFFAYIIAIAIIRHQLLDIRLAIRKTMALALLLIVMSGVLLVIYLMVSPGKSSLSYPFLLALAFLLLLFFEPLKARLESWSEVVWAPQRARYRRAMNSFARDIERVTSRETLAQAFLEAARTGISPRSASALIYDAPGRRYQVIGAAGAAGALEQEHAALLPPEGFPADFPPLAELEPIRRLAWDLSAEDRRRQSFEKLYLFMSKCGAEAVIMLFCRDSFMGLLSVGAPDGRDVYSRADFSFLEDLAVQGAAILANLQVLERVRTADRLAALGEMAASIAHEIRNPLGSMKGAAQYVKDKIPEADDKRAFLEIIISEIDRLSEKVNAFLQFARPAAPELRPEDLGGLIRRSVNLLEKEESFSKVTVRVEEENAPPVMADADMTHQIILNLLKNSAQALTHGGTAYIRVRTAPDDPGYVEAEFSDSGQGISPELRERIFNPFFTTRKGGTGLGLSVSLQLATAQGGALFLRNGGDGDGVVFVYRLRRADLSPKLDGKKHEKTSSDN